MGNNFSIVIPSKSIGNLTACVKSLRERGETARVIAVWDGFCSHDEATEVSSALLAAHPLALPMELHAGAKPFIFARNVNIGIRAAGRDDVLLLNDDCLLKTGAGFTNLGFMCEQYGYGAICPGFDIGGCRHLNLVGQGRHVPVDEPTMLIFACCYIPRSTIDRVGLLDERFGINAGGRGSRGYGLEDDDYSLRIRKSGLKLGVFDGVSVDHTTLKSTFRHDPEHRPDVRAHEELFRQIHGHWPEGHGYAPK